MKNKTAAYLTGQFFEGLSSGLFSVALRLGRLITGLLVSWLFKLYSHALIMQCSIMLLALILVLMSGVTQPLTIIVLMVLFGFFNALNRIARTNWMHHTTSMAQRGRIHGFPAGLPLQCKE